MIVKIFTNPDWRNKNYKEKTLVTIDRINKVITYNKRCYLVVVTPSRDIGFLMSEEEADKLIDIMATERFLDLTSYEPTTNEREFSFPI